MNGVRYDFLGRAGKMFNAGMTRAQILSGNIYDLFFSEARGAYIPLIELLTDSWGASGKILVVYELNGPIRFVKADDLVKVRDAWCSWRYGLTSDEIAIRRATEPAKSQAELEVAGKDFDAKLSAAIGQPTVTIRRATEPAKSQAELEVAGKDFDAKLSAAIGQPTVALEFLRQLCLCSRSRVKGHPVLDNNLIIIVEGADLLIPDGEISRLSDADRHRIGIFQDWLSDPAFLQGGDAVLLIAESRSLIHHRIGRLPQVLDTEVPSPDESLRLHFITWFRQAHPRGKDIKLWGTDEELAEATAALSIHALNQLLLGAAYEQRAVTQNDVTKRVEEYIQAQLGEDVVEFKKPTHSFSDLVGFKNLIAFLRDKLAPRLKSSGPSALSGAAVAGPLGAGKTYIFEALAAHLGMPVLVIKNLRSQWFGQTDVIWERFRRVVSALSKVLIFMDEADTQLGGVGPDVHETERRLTGKVQAMMSDTSLRGKVIWLLMTARIHLLSPDIRRPGRVGDLIIPVLDPVGQDRQDFLRWVVKPVADGDLPDLALKALDKETQGYSAASFASLRSELQAECENRGQKLSPAAITSVVRDHLPPAIGPTRRYQELQALINCTRRSLLPDPSVGEVERQKWADEVAELEARGIR